MKTAPLTLSMLVSLCFVGVIAIAGRAQTVPMGVMAEHPHAPAQPSTRLVLTVDGKATTLSVADLSAMPQTSITVHNEHTKADETCSGVLLGAPLAKYGLPVDKTTHQKDVAKYARLRLGGIPNDPTSLIVDKVKGVMRVYAQSC